jgi:hypothetical protein
LYDPRNVSPLPTVGEVLIIPVNRVAGGVRLGQLEQDPLIAGVQRNRGERLGRAGNRVGVSEHNIGASGLAQLIRAVGAVAHAHGDPSPRKLFEGTRLDKLT